MNDALKRLGGRGRLLLTIPVWVVLGTLPLWLLQGEFGQSIMVRVFVLAGLAFAFNIIGGFGGQLSLGNGAFFGLGAYTSALLLIHFNLTPWVGMFGGGIIATILAVGIGFPTFRLRGIYFALATFAVTLILEILTRHFGSLTGGDVGLSVPLKGNAPGYMQFDNTLPYYLLGLGLVIVCFVVNRAVLRSKFGYCLLSIKYDQAAASTLGVNALKMKLLAFVLSGFLSGMIGGFYVQYYLFIDPATGFGMNLSVQIVLLTVAGGLGSVWGPLLGAAFLIPVGEASKELLSEYGAGIDKIIYAVILIAFVILLPRGLVSVPKLISGAVSRRRTGNGRPQSAAPSVAEQEEVRET